MLGNTIESSRYGLGLLSFGENICKLKIFLAFLNADRDRFNLCLISCIKVALLVWMGVWDELLNAAKLKGVLLKLNFKCFMHFW